MTTIVVVGDTGVGKTKFMHLACHGSAPLNIYRSVQPETFTLEGTYGTQAHFIVLPGHVRQDELVRHLAQAEGLIIIYNAVPHTARRWLLRCTAGKPTSLPIMVCRHNNGNPSASRGIADMLRDWPTAEHTNTSEIRLTGMQDCANRIVRRARAELGSPIGLTA